MKNPYDVSIAQLITLWVFAAVIFIVSNYTEEPSLQLIELICLFGVIFYTLGWFSNRKKK